MSRTVSSTIQSAIAQDATRPIYLIEMDFSTTSYAATWDAVISYGGNSYVASGIEIGGLSATGATMRMPTGADDPWLALILNEGTRGRAIRIYEHHYDSTASPQSDAVLVFSGIMDMVTITDKIIVKIIEASRAKAFPALSVEETTFTHLLQSGTTITWGQNTLTVI